MVSPRVLTTARRESAAGWTTEGQFARPECVWVQIPPSAVRGPDLRIVQSLVIALTQDRRHSPFGHIHA